MASLIGTWALQSSEGFDEYMEHLGVNALLRKMGNTLKPDCIISKDGDNWKIVTSSTFKTTEATFQAGVTFEEKTADDRDVKSTVTFVGEKMIHVQEDPKKAANNSTIERFVEGDTLVALVKCGAMTAKRVYKKKN